MGDGLHGELELFGLRGEQVGSRPANLIRIMPAEEWQCRVVHFSGEEYAHRLSPDK